MRGRCISIGAALSIALALVQADHNISPLHYGAVVKRQGCPGGYFSCDSQGSAFLGTCCQNGQLCALDQNNQAACCPQGAVCTGNAGTAGPAATPTASFVSNQYFNFPAIPTSFVGTAACSSAVSACSRNFDICTSDLASGTGGSGVTIMVPGAGGTTIAPTHTSIGSSSAASVCSSLSSRACYGLQGGRCAQTGNSGGFVVGTANGQPRQTAACMAGVIAGLGVGIVGGNL